MQLVYRRDQKALLTCIFFIFFSLSALLLPAALKRWTHSFHLARCKLPDPQPSEVFSTLRDKEIEQILSQNFYYLNRGAQSFVFISEDQEFVLKLFFYDPTLGLLDRIFKPHRKGRAKKKRDRVLEACRIASKVSDETALLYAHPGPSLEKLPKVRLVGPAFRRVDLDCSNYSFALQRRADSFKSSLYTAYKEGNKRAFFQKISSFYSLLERRIAQGIHNADGSLFPNFGFIANNQAIEIDFGNYRMNDVVPSEEDEINHYKVTLAKWIHETLPEWKDELY